MKWHQMLFTWACFVDSLVCRSGITLREGAEGGRPIIRALVAILWTGYNTTVKQVMKLR